MDKRWLSSSDEKGKENLSTTARVEPTKRINKSPSHSSNKSPGKSPPLRNTGNFNNDYKVGLDVSENDRKNAVFVTGKSL